MPPMEVVTKGWGFLRSELVPTEVLFEQSAKERQRQQEQQQRRAGARSWFSALTGRS